MLTVQKAFSNVRYYQNDQHQENTSIHRSKLNKTTTYLYKVQENNLACKYSQPIEAPGCTLPSLKSL